MPARSLKDVLELGYDLRDIIEAQVQNEPALLNLAQRLVRPSENIFVSMVTDETRVWQSVGAEQQVLAARTKFLEVFMTVALRTTPAKDIVAELPEGLRSAEAADLFEKHEAQVMATLCRMSLE